MRLTLVPFLIAAFAAQGPPSARITALRNVTVLPMTGAPPLQSATVLMRGDRIAAIGPAAEVTIPAGARVIDGTGKFLMPGLIEMHAHLSKTRASALGLFVASGVTTVRDMGGDYEELRQWRQDVMAGKRVGPRVVMAGPILESVANIERMRRDPPSERVEPFERVRVGIGSPGEARATVARLAALDIDFLKIRTVHNLETYMALNEAAAAHGLALVGHTPPFPAATVLAAGQDGIDHAFSRPFSTESRDERIATWRRFAAAGVPVVPTLITIRAALDPVEKLRAIVDDVDGKIEPRRRYLSKYLILDWREQLRETTPQRQEALGKALLQWTRDLREMHEAGMNVLAGADVAVLNVYPGSSLHEEVGLFVSEMGMSPAEALDRATRRSAAFLRLGDSIGTIERGKIADLVLLDANPLADIANTRRIAGVMLRGQFYDRAGLDAMQRQVLTAPDLSTDDWGRTGSSAKAK
jgi:imidazolonepropionase-like amidohydrolase